MDEVKHKSVTLEEVLAQMGVKPEEENVNKLVLLNDDINTFDWVIYCLMSILEFDLDKATKTAWEVHTKGRSIIKTGSVDELKPFKTSLEERGLSLEIQK